ncbi:MAG: dephospho-CoA kinase, partial [Proteobacteria bacterium]|nr:dephospho-CoA kinase [Pseudomonadota bacterium]
MAKSETFVVVLTGGIAAGKTAVSDLFAQRGVPVIDTDQIAHEIVEPGQPALKRIAEAFGQEFLGADGRLDRKKMRNAIFSSPQQKTRLEGILHPAIVAEADHRIAQIDAPWCILVVPLLTETSLLPRIDRVLVVDVEESIQIERVMARDKISQQQAQSILAAQTSRRQRLALADDILDNSGSLE